MAQITEATDEGTADSDGELYDLFEVLATEKADRRKRDAKKVQEAPAPPPQHAPTSSASVPTAPTNVARSAPQYRYQSNAEDQQLTTQLFNLLLEGKLTQATPAHILAASASIRKDLVERLRTRRVEAAVFEQPSPSPVSMPSPEPEYSLPLQEIDILVGGHSTVAGVIDPGSQIVAIRKDLADEVTAGINPGVRLEMEGANGATNWTLGCAEHLAMQVGDIPFTLHAHVVEHAPFRLLLGRPCQHLLLCSLEDKPDGHVNITARDPRNRDRKISVPTRERRMKVGFIHTMSYQVPTLPNLTYKKVHPVAASLPEDSQISYCRPDDPLL
ncbi:MAG TPA: retropepsin-like aspartic protease, partial [Ktedonobacteraceae bacterium]|nr:retropepsin-like aspartic protease [Ktedonobacteraceae bacterium]